ncbi:MAG: GspH/FimT family pseudopilin [Verrucomicrobiota bacterium]|jgi:type II secretion system protein H
MKLRMVNCKLRVTRNRIAPRSGAVSPFVIRHSSFSGHSSFSPAFTLIELLLVLSLLVVITSLTAPAMATFIRSRALDSETRRLMALMHAAQSRAVSEGMPVMLWVDAQNGAYGLSAETTGKTATGKTDDPKAETLQLDSTLQITVLHTGTSAGTTYQNLPAIRFEPDGTVDEDSPQMLQLTDSAGVSRWLIETRTHTGYEVRDTDK